MLSEKQRKTLIAEIENYLMKEGSTKNVSFYLMVVDYDNSLRYRMANVDEEGRARLSAGAFFESLGVNAERVPALYHAMKKLVASDEFKNNEQ